jgi:hypothetical protein
MEKNKKHMMDMEEDKKGVVKKAMNKVMKKNKGGSDMHEGQKLTEKYKNLKRRDCF